MTKKKRGRGRPPGSKNKAKRGRGRPPGKKKKSVAKKAPGRPKALSKKQPLPSANLVAGKFAVCAVGVGLLMKPVKVEGVDGTMPLKFSFDHAHAVGDFEVFSSKPEAAAFLSALRGSFGLEPKKEEPKAETTLAEDDDIFGKPEGQADLGLDAVPGVSQDVPPPAPPVESTSSPLLDPVLADALVRSEVVALGSFFATSYAIDGDNNLSKTVTWKDSAVSLATAIRGVRTELTEQVKTHVTALKEFDKKVNEARKDHLADVKAAEKVLAGFDKLAKAYA